MEDYFGWLGIIKAIPKKWESTLNTFDPGSGNEIINCNANKVCLKGIVHNINKISSKTLYKVLYAKKTQQTSS
jgi:hypothetical protein